MTDVTQADAAQGGQGVDHNSPTGTAVRGERKLRQGLVVSNKMDKTVVVEVRRSVRHALYGRTVTRRKRYKAHDEHNECNVGDRVELQETRPLSKEKRWRVSRIVERAR